MFSKIKSGLKWFKPRVKSWEIVVVGRRYKIGKLLNGKEGELTGKIITVQRTRKTTVFFIEDNAVLVNHVAKSQKYILREL